MNGKLIAFIVIVVVIGIAIWFLPGGETPETPQPAPQSGRTMSDMGETATPGGQTMEMPEIDSLKVSVQDSTGKELAELTLVPDTPVRVPNTDYSLLLTDFYTHFMMEDSGPVNVSPHPENQAARIEIQRDGETVDYTWTFEKVPYFRMGGMGGPHDHGETTGLAFAVLDVYGLDAPHQSTSNP